MSCSDEENYAQNRRRAAELDERRLRIQRLNDALRTTLTGGYVTLTHGVQELGATALPVILSAVRRFDRFDADNAPYGEHDFGSITCAGHRLFWKIDYYGLQLEYGSPDPSDPAVTSRVLTIMLAEEY